MTEMEKIVEMLLANKFGNPKEVMDKLQDDKEEDSNHCEFSNNELTIYVENVKLHLDRYGNIKVDDKSPQNTEKVTIPIGMLQSCLQYIINIHIKEKDEYWNLLQQAKQANETKTKYIHTKNKKAFITGMIMGKNEKS